MMVLGDATQGVAVLLDVRSTQFVRANLVLLKGLWKCSRFGARTA